MHQVRYTYSRVRCDRYHVLNHDDVDTLLGRLPYSLWQGLKAVHFNDRGRARVLGYVNKGRREIGLCAQPPRTSFHWAATRGRGDRMKPLDFGGPGRGQWPRLAVRRFMLYEVFLHELGHLQLVEPNRKSDRLRYAKERRAESFARCWRRRLWAEHFQHPDPVHSPPGPEELHWVRTVWTPSHAAFKRGFDLATRRQYELAIAKYEEAIRINDRHSQALVELGRLVYYGLGTERSYTTSIRHLEKAVELDDAPRNTSYYLALALAAGGRLSDAEHHFEHAAVHCPNRVIAHARYAHALSCAGRFDEADRLFDKAMRLNKRSATVLYLCAWSLLDPRRPECHANVDRAAALVARAAKLKGNHLYYQPRLKKRAPR